MAAKSRRARSAWQQVKTYVASVFNSAWILHRIIWASIGYSLLVVAFYLVWSGGLLHDGLCNIPIASKYLCESPKSTVTEQIPDQSEKKRLSDQCQILSRNNIEEALKRGNINLQEAMVLLKAYSRIPVRRYYPVEPGDTLRSISKKLFDDEMRWQELYDLNRQLLESSAGSLPEKTMILVPGC